MIHFKKDMPNDEYHKHPAVSRSGLMTIYNHSPMHFKYQKDSGGVEETDALRIGGAFHTMVLEPELFDAQYYVFEKPDLRSKAGKEEMAAIKDDAGDKTLINTAEHAQMIDMAQSIKKQPAAKKLIHEKGIIEGSFFWQDDDTGVEVKARPDWHTSRLVTDLKTADNASPHAFEKKIFDYGYDIQVYMCREAIKKKYGQYPDGFVFIVVEKKPPYACAFYMASDDVIQSGKYRYLNLIETYSQCLRNNKWYGYGNHIQPISIPQWAKNRMEYEN